MKRYLILLIGLILLMGGCSNNQDSQPERASNVVLERMHQSYKEEGLECKAIEEPVERGDCFQQVNEKYLDWKINTNTVYENIYFSQDYSDSQDIFSFSVNESDELVEQQLDYYDEYVKNETLETAESKGEMLQSHWYIFSKLFPKEYREDLVRIVISDLDGPLFLVGRDQFNTDNMLLIVSDDTFDYFPSYKSVLIHEFAHILTLNKEQIKFDSELYLSNDEEMLEEAASKCPSFFWFGCMNEESYLHQYYLAFWEDLKPDHESIDWANEEEANSFYLKYEDYFLNIYQILNPSEDIAESFTFFIMFNSDELKEQAEMKYEKVKFFYQYEQLVNLRALILENLYDLSVRDKEFY